MRHRPILEGAEVVPLRADPDATSTITVIMLVIGFLASTFHTVPNAIQMSTSHIKPPF